MDMVFSTSYFINNDLETIQLIAGHVKNRGIFRGTQAVFQKDAENVGKICVQIPQVGTYFAWKVEDELI